MLGAAYRQLEAPPTEYRDWVWRAEKTLNDLETAPEATIRHYGHTYIHPYTASRISRRHGADVDHRAATRLCGLDRARHPVRTMSSKSGLDKFHDRDTEDDAPLPAQRRQGQGQARGR